MKKTWKQIAAIVGIIAIIALIVCYIISAFYATPDSRNLFFALYFAIIAVPILLWLFLLCYGRFKNKHTIAEFFPDSEPQAAGKNIVPENKEPHDFTEEELTSAMENSQK